MARKRQSQRGVKASTDLKDAACVDAIDAKSPAEHYTLEQAMAELDRLHPWSRTLPICKALLQAEISRLCAAGPDGKAETAPEVAVAASAAPKGPLSRESSESDAAKVVPCTEPNIIDGGADKAVTATEQPPASIALASGMAQEVEPATPEHWDSEEEAKTSAYLDGSVDGPADEDADKEEPGLEKAQLRIRIPVEEYPGYNFIGRLLGPRGATLKQLELSSKCRLYIRGRGSLR